MKVQSIGTSTTGFMKTQPIKSSPAQNQPTMDNTGIKNRNEKIMLYLAGGAAIAMAGIYIAKKGALDKVSVVSPINESRSKYIETLATGLGEYLRKPVKTESLSSVADKTEFLGTVSRLQPENFVASKENIENGVFKADLHSHSVFSDGKATVEEILDEVANYADKLEEKTGDKFLFALTDHDSAEGVKKALGIISEKPDKFKNVKFVTGAEVSYLIKSDKGNQLEPAELLVYGFNPFSKNVDKFFKNTSSRRADARTKYIEDLSELFPDTKFSKEEFNDVFLGENHSHNPIMNSYWETYHYGQVKKVLSDTAKAKGENPEEYFAQTMAEAPEKLNLYEFKKKGLVEGWISDNPQINKLNENYKPYIDPNGNIVKRGENTLEDISEAFKDEPDCVMGFAHPYYLSQRTSDIEGVVNEAKNTLKDKLILTESYHQAYSSEINKSEINNVTNFAERVTSQKVGGRDNHSSKWLDI